MKRSFLVLSLLLLFLWLSSSVKAQEVKITELNRTLFPNNQSCFAARIDRLDRPYIYTANLGEGFSIYNISDEESPQRSYHLEITTFDNQWVTNIVQYGSRLYLSLGDFQGATRPAGIAILDISNIESPNLLGYQLFDEYDKGCSIIRVKDDIAYLGLMEHGVLVVDIENPEDMTEIKHIDLDINFPEPPGLFSKPHARGMDVSGDYLLVCHDAGGLRTIDISTPADAQEVGKYVNTGFSEFSAVVYNNIVVAGEVAYVSLDYCGVEVIDISDPENIKNISIYNPNDCTGTNWVGSPSHTNEILVSPTINTLFVSAGDSEIWSFDISNPFTLLPSGSLAEVGDSSVTWGMDQFGKYAVGAFINVKQVYIPGITPFYADWGGWRLYEVDRTSSTATSSGVDLSVSPNPANDFISIKGLITSNFLWVIYNIYGEQVKQGKESSVGLPISLDGLSNGHYIIHIANGEQVTVIRFLLIP